MGIKHFWIWFKENFGNDIKTHNNIYKIDTFGIDVDMLAIDMNGIFHTCAQKVYKYGNSRSSFQKNYYVKILAPKRDDYFNALGRQ